ncbi:MAG: hypothetical protein ACREMK_10975 [Gemmatimonadota bacterium]
MRPTGLLTLRFSADDLEREFRAEYARSAIRPARTITILIIAIYIGYVPLDLWTGSVVTNLPVRVSVTIVMSAILALTWHPLFARAHSWILSIGALTTAGGIFVMMALTPQHQAAYYPGMTSPAISMSCKTQVLFELCMT